MVRSIECVVILVLLAQEYSAEPVNGPRFLEAESNVTITEGQTATLPCNVMDLPDIAKVAWLNSEKLVLTFNERSIANDDRMSVRRRHWNDWSLVIQGTLISDQGVYYCLVGTLPMKSKQVYLTVLPLTTDVPSMSTTEASNEDSAVQHDPPAFDTTTDQASGMKPNKVSSDHSAIYSTETLSTTKLNDHTVDYNSAATKTPSAANSIATTIVGAGFDKDISTVITTQLPPSDVARENNTTNTAEENSANKASCNPEPADIVFLLDASNSIWLPDFQRQKVFVESVIRTFNVGPEKNQTRIGVITFGHGVWPKFYLRTYSDLPSYITAIRRIRHGRGNRTNTGDALVFTRDVMFSERAGGRENVTRIAVVLSDGRSQATLFTQETAIDLQKRGITLFAVSVGFRLDHKELATIASDPDNRHYFSIDDYSELTSIKDQMTEKICGVPQPSPQVDGSVDDGNLPSDQDASTQLCSQKLADVFFLVDSSYSISKENFAREMEFVHSVIDVLDIGVNKTRVGVMTFSDTSEFSVNLDNSMTKDQYQMRLNSVRYMGGGTDTATALRRMREEGFTSGSGESRVNAVRIAIVLTDGLSLTPDVTAREADLARKTGIQIFSIGIGNGVDKRELADIASDPDDKFVLHVNDFWALDEIKRKLAIRACAVKPASSYLGDSVPTPVCAPSHPTDILFIYDAMTLGSWRSQTISQFIAKSLSDVDLVSGKLRVGREIENCVNGNIRLGGALQSSQLSAVEYSTFYDMLKMVRRNGFSVENGGRENASKMAVIFVDAEMRMDISTLQEAKKLKKDIDFFYVIAFGQSMRASHFISLAENGQFITIDSYEALAGMADKLQGDMCDFFFTNSGR